MRPHDQPYALKDAALKAARLEMLGNSTTAKLTQFVEAIRAENDLGADVPYFDPCDGGTSATTLLLLEAPGKQAVLSGFVSRNNPDPTARNLCELMRDAGLRRETTVIWNIVPWYIGTSDKRKIAPPKSEDLRKSRPYLFRLLDLLTGLENAVLVGRKAQVVADDLKSRGRLKVLETFHPSARVFNMWPDKKRHFINTMEAVRS